MFRFKTEHSPYQARNLDRLSPISRSEQKQKKQSKLYKSISITQQLKIKLNNILPKHSVSPPSGMISPQKLIIHPKLKVKSPREHAVWVDTELNLKSVREVFHTNQNTSRNIDEIKRKMMGSKLPLKIGNKFFKREKEMADKFDQMNRALRMVAQMKPKKDTSGLRQIRKLGKSQTGEILLSISNVNRMVMAIKTFKKEQVKLEFLIDQMKIHLYCNHPNILPAYGLSIGKEQVYLMMEVGSRNLYDQILKDGPFTEKKTARYISQIMSGVDYLHRLGVMHRDLKPENIISFGNHLKITDFGWSIKTQKMRKTLCGTLDYLSPEVTNRQPYDNKIDCWSIGVLMYEMLTVKAPFSTKNPVYDFQGLSLPQDLSLQARDLLSKLLQVDPNKRLSAREGTQHIWLKRHKKIEAQQQRRKFGGLINQLNALFQ